MDTKLFDRNLESELVASSEKHCSVGMNLVCHNNDDHKVPFVFLSVFKWEERKGWDILLNAYWKAFGKDDDVVLLIHSHLPPPHTLRADINQIISDYAMRVFETSMDDLAAVHWIDNLHNAFHPKLIHHIGWHKLVSSKVPSSNNIVKAGLTRRQVRQLYTISDAFVLPTRGEGWGLPIAEAMAMELPVLVTNYSGPTAYIDEHNAYPIPVEGYLDDMSYAIPKEDGLVSLFTQVVSDSFSSSSARTSGVCINSEECQEQVQDIDLSMARKKGKRARQRMQEFNSTMVVSIMQDRLSKQAERRGWKFTV
ncbi:glycosyltransferase [archaeon]|nr:MAG: glycosyltransferase [archaeon]